MNKLDKAKSDLKIISPAEQKQIMLDMLKFVDEICRKNNIEYSLIGGSLIGAIRHNGFIPWDDDLDIILTKENYENLKKILDVESGRYQTLKPGKGGEQFSYIKLIDTYTQIEEGRSQKLIPDYGVYIDIFCFYPISDDYAKRRRCYKKIELLVSLIARRRLDFTNLSLRRNLMRLGKNLISSCIGYKNIGKMFNKILTSCPESEYVISNWPVYGFDKEIFAKKNTEKYVDAKFEDLTIMIFKDYDAILRVTFDDYMKFPPKSMRIAKHDIRAWWRDVGAQEHE